MKDFDKYCSPYSASELRERLGKIRHVAFDMDGTIYMGSTLFPFTVATLQRLRDNGIGYSFLTNNPSRSIDAYLRRNGYRLLARTDVHNGHCDGRLHSHAPR